MQKIEDELKARAVRLVNDHQVRAFTHGYCGGRGQAARCRQGVGTSLGTPSSTDGRSEPYLRRHRAPHCSIAHRRLSDRRARRPDNPVPRHRRSLHLHGRQLHVYPSAVSAGEGSVRGLPTGGSRDDLPPNGGFLAESKEFANTDPVALKGWDSGQNAALVAWVGEHQTKALKAYGAQPLLLREHAHQEESYRTGGYAQRQVFELAQNAADALARANRPGRVEFRLTQDALYCADEGQVFDRKGLEAISFAHLSPKRGEEMGRFGLGFKSVLGVSDSPQVLSRSISVGFDRTAAAAALKAAVPDATEFPVLRWPTLIDPVSAMEQDPILRELAWASTIIKVPLREHAEHLVEHLRDFPAEFLLLAPHIAEMRLTCTAPEDTFELTVRCETLDGPRRRLRGGGKSTDWLVWHRHHEPSEDALAEVGQTIRRDRVRVSYAVALDDATSVGRFWAYFPLQDQTSARGIHNAPWRVSDDRTTMIPGVFNNELLDVLGGLIVEAMPWLATDQDPARHFDYLPARGREAQYEADRYLAEIIPILARRVPCVPNALGALTKPDELVVLNSDVRFGHGTYVTYERRTTDPATTPHSACYTTTTRRARLRSLVRPTEGRAAPNEIPADKWLERLVVPPDDDRCRAALDVVFAVDDEPLRREFASARILPDTGGTLHDLRSTKTLFISGSILSGTPGLHVMRESFAAHALTQTRLLELGFEPVDATAELRRLLGVATRKWGAREWDALWGVVPEVTAKTAEELLTTHVAQGGELRIRVRSGKWVSPYAAIVPGVAEPLSADLSVDEVYHEDHLPQLVHIGLGRRPQHSAAALHDLTYMEYLRLTREQYVAQFKVAPRPTKDACNFVSGLGLGPLYVLPRFRDTNDETACAIWTRELLEADLPATESFGHVNARQFPPMEVQAPHIWAAARYGLIETAWGHRPATATLHPDLREHAPLLPVAAYDAAAKLRTIRDLDEVPGEVWVEFIERDPRGGTAATLGAMLVLAASDADVAGRGWNRVPAMVGTTATSAVAAEVLVATTDEELRVLVGGSNPHVRVSDAEECERLVGIFGCQSAAAFLTVEHHIETPGEPIALLDRFSGLRRRGSARLDGWTVVSGADLYRSVTTPEGTTQDSVEVAFVDADPAGRILHVTDLDDHELLAHISDRFDLRLDDHAIDRVLEDTKDQDVRLKISQCRLATSIADKLAALLPDSALETKLPRGLLNVVRDTTEHLEANHIAALLHQVHGYNVLVELKHLLAEAGFDTPKTWAGSPGAVGFVRSLDMPVEYAGSSSATLGPELTVLGPPGLPTLHPYQKDLRDLIRDLIQADPAERALMYLPTGAGKTRVSIEALVDAIRAGDVRGPVLWIAQTEELCEQAVQTWSTVWREFGDRPLKVYRLWSTNNVGDSADEVSVIVATDAKLASIRDRDEYQWLPRRVHPIVLDEAHGAIATGITETLRWLGIDGKRTERPFLGLTATPFRGGEDATKRLVSRFGNNLLNVLGEDPYKTLQDDGVLARVEHRELAGGEFRLDASELPHYEKFHDVPKSVLDRVGKDQARTQALVDDIATLPTDWPVLVFTASVLSAQILAALLRLKKIEASSVSGATPVYERRRIVEDFRRGALRVVTNCNVLTEGFDAPAVRALYIARPTFSPNAYVQMVGRGLRGPKNGGKEECLVVNIADTFAQFGHSLAYKQFNYLWASDSGGAS